MGAGESVPNIKPAFKPGDRVSKRSRSPGRWSGTILLTLSDDEWLVMIDSETSGSGLLPELRVVKGHQIRTRRKNGQRVLSEADPSDTFDSQTSVTSGTSTISGPKENPILRWDNVLRQSQSPRSVHASAKFPSSRVVFNSPRRIVSVV